MVAGGLAGGIRAVRLVAVAFLEGGVFRTQRAIDLIGGNVQETEFIFGRIFELTVEGTHRLQQTEGSDDIGLNEVFRAVNAAVHMRFGGKIDHRARLVLGPQLAGQFEIADVALYEDMAGVALQRSEVFPVAGVSQHIQVDHRLVGLSQPIENKIAANETCGPCKKYHLSLY